MQVPGLQDPAAAEGMLGKTAKMTFQLVDETADPNSAIVPPEDELLPDDQNAKGAGPAADPGAAPGDGVGRPADRRRRRLRPADRPARW